MLRELGVWGNRPATPEGAREFRRSLEQLGTTYKVGVAPTDLDELEHAMRSAANRVGGAVIVSALLLASALLARVHDLRWAAFGLFCASFVLGLYMLWKIIRTPGEL